MRRRVRRIAVGATALTAGVTRPVLRPILWSSAVDVPDQFDEAASAVAFLEVAQAADLDHIHHKVQLDARLAPIMPWVASVGAAAAAADYDGDGWMELYAGNDFAPHDLWQLEHTRIMHDSFERSRNAGRNSLFHNNGDGTFRDITEQALGLDTRKGMNVDFGDYDAGGWLDVYVTNITTSEYLRECNMLWHNRALGADCVPLFIDESTGTGTCDGGWGWGAKFLDYDNDGDQDLVALNGFITAGEGSYWFDLASWTVTGDDLTDALNWPPLGDNSFSGREPTRLWRNDLTGFLVETAERAGIDDPGDGRGVVTFDYDNDGDLDLYFANQGQPPSLYRNEVGATGNWLELALTGRPDTGSNLDAIGARVTIVTAEGAQIRELDGGNSYAAQSERRLHFGLGDALVVDTLEVRWPSRRVQVLRGVLANQLLAIEEPLELPAVAALIPTRHGASTPPPAAPEEPRLPLSLEERALSPEERVLSPEERALSPEERVLSPEERATLRSSLEERVRARPEDVALAKAGDFSADAAVVFVEAVRNLEQQVDTDNSFLMRP